MNVCADPERTFTQAKDKVKSEIVASKKRSGLREIFPDYISFRPGQAYFEM
jgi:hypothetical protein